MSKKNKSINNLVISETSISQNNSETEREKAVRLTREKVTIHEMINFDKIPENPVKVSIVVPVCNVEQYLRECLDSCINQTLNDIEIICVNDGSKDGSLEILKGYAANDNRVKVIDKDNAGYGHTMNIGMDMACGEYIGIVESDDFVDLQMYEELYNIAVNNDVDLVKADFNRFYGTKDNYVLEYNKIARENSNYNRIICPSEEPECFRFIMNTWSGIYSRRFLLSHGIRHNETPGASFQDNGFWFKTFAESSRTLFVDKPYYMNRRDNPNSSVYNPEKIYCGNDEYKYIREYLRSNQELEEKFLYIFSQKRYHTYLFTLNRIADKFKRDYLHTFAEDFKEFESAGELNRAYFTNKEWETMHWIMRDPDEYYYNEYMRLVKVSVIIPVYNTEKYLAQCLDSLISQSFKNFEAICIDDGSTDNSFNVLYDYSMRDKRIKVYRQENSGAGTARNFGLSVCHGEYILFVDSDDFFDKNMLKEAYNKAILDDSDICIFKSRQYDEQTGKLKDCTFSVRIEQLPKNRPFSISDIQCNPFTAIMGWAWDKLYKKSFIINNGLLFQEQRTTNDMYFVFASILSAKKITIVDKPLYFQRRNVPNSLSATRELSWECFYKALMKVKQELIDKGMYENRKQHFVNYALHSCLWNFNTLPEKTAILLFNNLREGWFSALDIQDYGPEYYSNKQEYEQYLQIINTLSDSVENIAYCSYQNNLLKAENEKLRDPLIKISSKESLNLSQVVEKLQWNREQRQELTLQINKLKESNNQITKIRISPKEILTPDECREKLIWNRSERERLLAENKQLINEIGLIRKSFTFRLAMFFTWIPRKIRSKKMGKSTEGSGK